MNSKKITVPVTILFVSLIVFSGTYVNGSNAPYSGIAQPSFDPSINSPPGNSNPPVGEMPQGPVPPGGSPPIGQSSGSMPPGGSPSGGPQTQSSFKLNGSYSLNGGVATEKEKKFSSSTNDLSAIFVTNGGKLTLINPTIVTTGTTSSNEASSFYGLNGAVLANNGSSVTISGGSIVTSGAGANAAIPTGTGTSISLTDTRIKATGNGGHGVMATLGASLTLRNVSITTSGTNSAPIATDRGGGTVSVTGGSTLSTGTDSPGIYSTGNIHVSRANIKAIGSEAAVIEGFNSISLENTTLTGGIKKTGGVMIYQSMSGDASVGTGSFTMKGGSLTGTEGPLFFITNTHAVIKLDSVTTNALSGTVLNAGATSRWGTSGSNGGSAEVTTDNTSLSGSVITDSISSVSIHLQNKSVLSGSINTASLSLDSGSRWNVTGNSRLSGFTDPGGVSGLTIKNVIGNGFTVYYDPSLSSNQNLGGKTYELANGGKLVPKKN